MTEHPDRATIHSAFDLTGKVAVLTGAASGIGRSTTRLLAAAGATVVIGDIDGNGLAAVAAELADRDQPAVAMQTDVSKASDVDALVARATKEFGRLDIMANIAGIANVRAIVDITDDEMERIIGINYKSVLFGCRAALRVMIPQKSGNIVNVASGIIDSGAAGYALYGSTKSAVTMLTKVAAQEGGPHGIRANAIAPGMILTAFSTPRLVDEEGNIVEEKVQAYKDFAAQSSSLRRHGTPEDVAWSILYAVSDAASFVTGQILRPNGGTSMPW